MKAFDDLQLKAIAATRELMMAVEFAEQARDAIDMEAFNPAVDSEIDSAESALVTVRACVIEMEELLATMKAEVAA